jgi:serine phosphatase RsbU (regulator of sigma subunit)/Tfp pilus assembly protein PilF
MIFSFPVFQYLYPCPEMRKRFIFIFILLAQFFFAQKTDSLKLLIKPDLNDTTRINLLNKVGMSYFLNEGQLDSSLVYLQMAKTLAYKTVSIKHQVNSLLNYALVVREKGSFEKAMEDYFEALKLAEKMGDKKLIGSSYSGIAVVYSFQKDQVKAREYYQKAMDIATSMKDDKKLASLNNNIGLTYMDERNFPVALKYMLVALTLNKKNKNDNGTAAAAENIGLIYDQLKNYDLAMNYYVQAYRIWTARQDVYSTAINMSYMAMTFNNTKEFKRAKDTAVKALTMSQSVGAINTQIDIHNYLSDTYVGLKDFETSLYHYKRGRVLKDSMKSDENIKAYTETQLKYSFYKQQMRDSLNYMVTVSKQEEQLKAEKTIRYFSFSAIAIFMILLFFLFKGYKEKKIANRIILKQKELVEEKQKEVIDSITYAKRIQTALLAGEKLLKENLKEYFVFFKPKDIVAGDFYWATSVKTTAAGGHQGGMESEIVEKFIYVTGDCTGHGVPGAFMSLLNISLLSETIREKKIIRPDEILNVVRSEIIKALNPEGSKEESKDGMDCVVIVLDKKNKTLEYAGANNSFYIVRDNELIVQRPDKMPVGKSHDNTVSFTYNKLDVKENDLIYTFSDGYADQFGGPNGKKFKYKQFCDFLLSISGYPLDQQSIKLQRKFEEWKGNLQQVDDVCVIGVRL